MTDKPTDAEVRETREELGHNISKGCRGADATKTILSALDAAQKERDISYARGLEAGRMQMGAGQGQWDAGYAHGTHTLQAEKLAHSATQGTLEAIRQVNVEYLDRAQLLLAEVVGLSKLLDAAKERIAELRKELYRCPVDRHLDRERIQHGVTEREQAARAEGVAEGRGGFKEEVERLVYLSIQSSPQLPVGAAWTAFEKVLKGLQSILASPAPPAEPVCETCGDTGEEAYEDRDAVIPVFGPIPTRTRPCPDCEECPECEGCGWVYTRYTSIVPPEVVDCDACKGTGRRKKETG